MQQETPNNRLERILKENNLSLSQNPLSPMTVSNGGILIAPPLYNAAFTDPAKEVHDAPREETPTETHE